MRKITERLEGYAFGVAHLQAPAEDKDLIVDEIHFLDHPEHPTHTIVVPLTAAGKQRLIAQLTGGVLIP